jgi:hypothetical protein
MGSFSGSEKIMRQTISVYRLMMTELYSMKGCKIVIPLAYEGGSPTIQPVLSKKLNDGVFV